LINKNVQKHTLRPMGTVQSLDNEIMSPRALGGQTADLCK
jgi:hypothetical protein